MSQQLKLPLSLDASALVDVGVDVVDAMLQDPRLQVRFRELLRELAPELKAVLREVHAEHPTDDEIFDRAGAARFVGMSVRTFERRLAADADLRLCELKGPRGQVLYSRARLSHWKRAL